MDMNAMPPPDEERVAMHKQSLVIDMVSIEKSEFDKMKKFYAKRYVYFAVVALVALLLGMLLRIMADAPEMTR
jgi:hypothetical protein